MIYIVFFLSILNCFLQVHAALDCSKYANDIEVLRSLPFNVPINPNPPSAYKTYATTYRNETTVVFLSLMNQKLIPSTIFCLQGLGTLYIMDSAFCDRRSSICQLSPEIERWSEYIIDLNIIRTRITHLPSSFGKLKRLVNLQLWDNDLITLPDSFSSLRSLSSLRITSNKIKTLPKGVGMLNLLSHITLDNNINLRSIQSLNGLQNLTTLSAINCSITSIPMKLPKLYFMEMTNNQINNLNGIQTIGSQQDLTKYFLYSLNEIRAIPSEISLVNNLHIFNISNNQFKNLPSTIFGYAPLGVLDITNNYFSSKVLKQIVSKFNTTNPNMRLIY